MKSVVHLNEYGSIIGGSEVYIKNVSARLRENGFSTFLLYEKKGTGTSFTELDSVEQLSSRAPDDSNNSRERFEQIKNLQPELIYIHNLDDDKLIEDLTRSFPTFKYFHDFRLTCPSGRTRGDAYICCAKKLDMGCQLIALRRKCMPRNPLGAFALIRKLRRQLEEYNKCVGCFVANRFMKDLLELNGVRKDKLHVNPYFTNFENIPVETISGNYLLFVGRLAPEKGVSYLFRAFARSRVDCELRVIGDGPERKDLERLVYDLEIPSRVTFLGWVDHERVLREICCAKALVVPSIWPEPFGIVGLEALACKTPVIAFDVGGISEWLHHGINGFLARTKDLEGLAASIKRLVSNPDIERSMQSQQYEKLVERFSSQAHLRTLLTHFRGVY